MSYLPWMHISYVISSNQCHVKDQEIHSNVQVMKHLWFIASFLIFIEQYRVDICYADTIADMRKYG